MDTGITKEWLIGGGTGSSGIRDLPIGPLQPRTSED